MGATAAYGSWESPITPAMLTHSAVGSEAITADGGDLYWVESRPTEAGRSVVVRNRPNGTAISARWRSTTGDPPTAPPILPVGA